MGSAMRRAPTIFGAAVETILRVEDEQSSVLVRNVLTRLAIGVGSHDGSHGMEVWKEHQQDIRLLLTDW